MKGPKGFGCWDCVGERGLAEMEALCVGGRMAIRCYSKPCRGHDACACVTEGMT